MFVDQLWWWVFKIGGGVNVNDGAFFYLLLFSFKMILVIGVSG